MLFASNIWACLIFSSKEESLRLLREYFLKNPPTSLREAFDQIIVAEHAVQGREPPPPRKQFPVDQEEEHDFSAGAPV